MLSKALEPNRPAVMPPVVLCDRQGYTRRLYPDRRVIPFDLDILGRRLPLAISYAQGPVTLADLVPMARTLSDVLTGQLRVTLDGFDRSASCRQGCAHCCYYLVPVSPAEAFHLEREMRTLPPPQQRAIVGVFRMAGRRLLKRLPEYQAERSDTHRSAERLQRLSDWYASLHLACPFLMNNLCAIYNLRPLACREYWVTSDPDCCRIDSKTPPTLAPLPVRIAEVLTNVCGEMEGESESVLLPVALPFAESQPDRCRRTWPAHVAVERFLDTLFHHAHRNSMADRDTLCATDAAIA